MPQVDCSLEISAPAAAVWETIADFGAIQRFLPMISRCELEGPDGVGQLRKLTLADVTLTVSRLAAIDPAARSLRYEILETKLPLADYSATMQVRELGPHCCEVSWSSRFEPDGATEAEARDFLETQLGAGLQALRELHETGA